MKAYLNPLNINFGHGRIAIRKFSDSEGRGVVFEAMEEALPIGEKIGPLDDCSRPPREGEVYLHFSNYESAEVLWKLLGEVLEDGGEFWKPERPKE